jgi:FkbM family methyltransferase
MLAQAKHLVGSWLVRHHQTIAPLLWDHHAPYRFAGGKIYLNVKESPMMLARAFGIYEPLKMGAVQHFLRPGMTFIDVGGNKGDFALLAAHVTGKQGTVLCFEPEPRNCDWVRKSIDVNRYANVTLYEMAISDHSGTAQLYLGRKSGWHTLLSGQEKSDAGKIKVLTTTLDGIVERESLKSVDVMKIDVEGAELQVLNGAQATLAANRNIVLLIDVHPKMGVKPQEVSSLLASSGFGVYRMEPPFDKLAVITDDLRELVAYRKPSETFGVKAA